MRPSNPSWEAPSDFSTAVYGEATSVKTAEKVRASKRKSSPQETLALSPGYVDIWAGGLLRGLQVLPQVRQLCSSTHPKFVSQNLLEEAVIWSALAMLNWEAILIADRGFRRKALPVKLLQRRVLFVIRLAQHPQHRAVSQAAGASDLERWQSPSSSLSRRGLAGASARGPRRGRPHSAQP